MQSLHCDMCHDTYKAPVFLPCLHTFCSLCIRKHARVRDGNPDCPTCCSPFQVYALKRNIHLENIIDDFERYQKQVEIKSESRDNGDSSVNHSGLDNKSISKRKRRTIIDDDVLKEELEHEVQDDFEPIVIERTNKRNEMDKIVQCCMCPQRVLLKHINEHMDSGCKKFIHKVLQDNDMKKIHESNSFFESPTRISLRPTRSASTPQLGSSKDENRKRKADLNYHGLKTTKLNEILAKDGLSTWGETKHKIKRHKYWTDLYNANLDQKNPLPDDKLRRQLEAWESELDGKRTTVGEGYLRDHASDFDKLVQELKERKRLKAQAKAKEVESVALSENPDSHRDVNATAAFDEVSEGLPSII